MREDIGVITSKKDNNLYLLYHDSGEIEGKIIEKKKPFSLGLHDGIWLFKNWVKILVHEGRYTRGITVALECPISIP